MATVNLFGVPHYYSLTADGEAVPIVFIHGWLLSHKYWHPIVHGLASSHPCLTYDLRGFGESRHQLQNYQFGIPQRAEALQGSTSPYGLGAYARDLAELLNQLNLDSAWLVGHSLGGSIALWTAYCYPHLVKGVIGLNAGGGIYLEQEFRQFRQLGQQILKFRFPWLRYVPLLPLMFSRSMVSHPLPYRWGAERLNDLLNADSDAALGTLLETTTEDEVHLLPRVVTALQQPVYFLGGCNDSVMDLKFVSHLAGYHRASGAHGAAVVEIPDCGHMAMLEQPEKVIATIQAVIQQCHQIPNQESAESASSFQTPH
jgi:2-succinyl-6-hydroxy-2,4-cyclohexadiene-1-carboxylate synthase